jgi:hypothetical protein
VVVVVAPRRVHTRARYLKACGDHAKHAAVLLWPLSQQRWRYGLPHVPLDQSSVLFLSLTAIPTLRFVLHALNFVPWPLTWLPITVCNGLRSLPFPCFSSFVLKPRSFLSYLPSGSHTQCSHLYTAENNVQGAVGCFEPAFHSRLTAQCVHVPVALVNNSFCSVVTRLGTGRSRVRMPAQGRNLSLVQDVQTGCAPPHPASSMVTETFSRE